MSSWCCSAPQQSFIYAGSELIVLSDAAKNFRVWFHNTLSMNKHMNFLCKTAFYYLRNLATIINRAPDYPRVCCNYT